MERSEEIRRVVGRWMSAIAAGDAASALGRLSEHPGTLAIGTDIAEWWHGPAARRVWRRQIDELGPFPIDCHEIEAWEEGSVGWASVRFTFTWEGLQRDARATCVMHLEHGEWRCVQLHWSHPSANAAIGMELTRTLDELERVVHRDRPDLSGSRAEDGTVTIAFTDIVDSTMLLSGLGDEAWLEILRRHNALITEVTDAHGGRVVETQGMGTFTALQRKGIPSRFLYFPDENHWVLKPANSILWHKTVLAWLAQWTAK